jgi:hypothetical protein
VRDSFEPRLRTGDGEASEGCALKASANFRSSVPESPRDRSVEIVARLDSGGRKRGVSHNDGQS